MPKARRQVLLGDDAVAINVHGVKVPVARRQHFAAQLLHEEIPAHALQKGELQLRAEALGQGCTPDARYRRLGISPGSLLAFGSRCRWPEPGCRQRLAARQPCADVGRDDGLREFDDLSRAVVQHGPIDVRHGTVVVRWVRTAAPREQLEERDADGVDVGLGAAEPFARLGCQVPLSPVARTLHLAGLLSHEALGLCEPDVGDQDTRDLSLGCWEAAQRHEDVGRLDVVVNDVSPMQHATC
mmetsp:Transcript_103986/g.292624  ORF Transcript_103986/g.292624 Transcript_103986/m.292624 type:complete len:241 (+) Transcript_103986:968-1690(+)